MAGPTTPEYDVIIVGAGLSGLTTAYRLELYNQAQVKSGNTGLKYIVLEGSDRIGGRIHSVGMRGSTPPILVGFSCSYPSPGEHENPSSKFDLGPTWFWPGYELLSM